MIFNICNCNIKFIISIKFSGGDVSLRFVKKQANKAAHELAGFPCSLNCNNVFLSRPGYIVGDPHV